MALCVSSKLITLVTEITPNHYATCGHIKSTAVFSNKLMAAIYHENYVCSLVHSVSCSRFPPVCLLTSLYKTGCSRLPSVCLLTSFYKTGCSRCPELCLVSSVKWIIIIVIALQYCFLLSFTKCWLHCMSSFSASHHKWCPIKYSQHFLIYSRRLSISIVYSVYIVLSISILYSVIHHVYAQLWMSPTINNFW